MMIVFKLTEDRWWFKRWSIYWRPIKGENVILKQCLLIDWNKCLGVERSFYWWCTKNVDLQFNFIQNQTKLFNKFFELNDINNLKKYIQVKFQRWEENEVEEKKQRHHGTKLNGKNCRYVSSSWRVYANIYFDLVRSAT